MVPEREHLMRERGAFAVGLRVIEQYDLSRVFQRERDDGSHTDDARPLQTLFWYPAEPGSKRNAMTVGDYVGLWATEISFDEPAMTAHAREWSAGLAASGDMKLWALRDAEAVPGRFPLVLYAPGFGGPSWENAELCEYLASHGYGVLASPSMGATRRAMTTDLAGLEAQARDLSFLIGLGSTLANVDATAVGVIGFSWGGLANVLAAARDARIRALISLDGSLRTWCGMLTGALGLSPGQIKVPLLSAAQGQWTLEEQCEHVPEAARQGPNILNAWTAADLTALYLLALAHPEFASMHLRNAGVTRDVLEPWHRRKGDHSREDVGIAFRWMAHYCLRFLRAYLGQDAEALAFLQRTPGENDVPPHVMAAFFRAAAS